MQVIVLGSGVIGVSTAYFLARAGHQVTVIDRQAGPARETSFANAGQVSPGYATPWAAPGVPLKALKWLLQRHAPLVLRLDGSWQQLAWLAQMLSQCNAARYAVNKARMVRLAEYSRDVLRALRQALDLQYDHGCGGTLQLFRSARQLDAAARDIAVLREQGVAHRLLMPAQLCEAEPALAPVLPTLTGGLQLPGDETGDCQRYTEALAQQAQLLGVQLRYGQTVQRLRTDAGGERIDALQVDGRWQPLAPHTQLVLALACASPALLQPLGLRLPVYPVKGYSLTLPIRRPEAAPRSTVLDETFKVALTRLGQRLRVGGMAELTGHDLRLDPRRRQTLEHVIGLLFPDAATLSEGQFWTGLRPMTPDGTPLIGATRWRNLWLNTGHGTLGWTMAAGSGRLLADLISGRAPEIDIEGLAVARFQA